VSEIIRGNSLCLSDIQGGKIRIADKSENRLTNSFPMPYNAC